MRFSMRVATFGNCRHMSSARFLAFVGLSSARGAGWATRIAADNKKETRTKTLNLSRIGYGDLASLCGYEHLVGLDATATLFQL